MRSALVLNATYEPLSVVSAQRATCLVLAEKADLLGADDMAVPKRKISKSRRGMRRSHDALSAPAQSRCPQCEAPKPPHRICPSCGTYRGREVVRVDEE